jgi:hypothetical protein
LQRFVVHLFISVAVCGFVVAAWALTSGSFAELSDIAGNPTLSRKLGFWPIWVILAAAAALLVDLGFVVAGVFGDRGRKKRRRRQIERTKRAARRWETRWRRCCGHSRPGSASGSSRRRAR